MQFPGTNLTGRYVRLEPIQLEHADELWRAAQEREIWRFLPASPRSSEEMRELIEGAVKLAEYRQGLGYALISQTNDEVIGSSGYWNLAPEHLRAEIGMTWITPSWQKTFANTEMKLLMLEHAFETVGCERIEFKTDARNTNSRRAIARIGAVEEGTLRSHMQYPSGERRDTVYFSILRGEWPQKKRHLQSLLTRT